jgi:tetraacyldisaccharide 4'-kinase
MLPTGNNREYESGIKRADIVILSKSPEVLSPIEKRNAYKALKLNKHQKLYFSYIKYGNPVALNKEHPKLELTNKNQTAVILTGIANPEPFIDYIKDLNIIVKHLKYNDHHQYSVGDLIEIQKIFDSIVGQKFMVTTEKDATRLQEQSIFEITKQLPIYYVPIEVEFNEQEKELFNKQIRNICQN